MYFDTTEFATRLSTLRKAQGMTQEEMAEALNCIRPLSAAVRAAFSGQTGPY